MSLIINLINETHYLCEKKIHIYDTLKIHNNLPCTHIFS